MRSPCSAGTQTRRGFLWAQAITWPANLGMSMCALTDEEGLAAERNVALLSRWEIRHNVLTR